MSKDSEQQLRELNGEVQSGQLRDGHIGASSDRNVERLLYGSSELTGVNDFALQALQ